MTGSNNKEEKNTIQSNTSVKKLAIIYPFKDLIPVRSGSSTRIMNLVHLLSYRINDIHIMQRWNSQSTSYPFEIISHKIDQESFRLRIFRRGYKYLTKKILPSTRQDESFWIWKFLEQYLVDEFPKNVEKFVDWADAVLLEYPFWASKVSAACQKLEKPLILTNHDVQAFHVQHSKKLQDLGKFLEKTSLRKVQKIVCVADQDQATFRSWGFPTTLIRNSIDFLWFDQVLPKEPRQFLKERGFEFGNKPICFFVGSAHMPNIIASLVIKKTASTMNLPEDPIFLVAGGCSLPTIEGSYRALGKVDGDVLLALYKASDLVLVPLQYGGGSSIKTIEALATGKAVLGTSVGFRGLNINDGYDAIIEDDFDRYPELIRSILNDRNKRSALEKNSKIFAKKYDYRDEFQKYMPLLGLPPFSKDEIHLIESNDRQSFKKYWEENTAYPSLIKVT